MFFTLTAFTTVSPHAWGSSKVTPSDVAGGSWYYREFVSSHKKIELALINTELDEGEPRPSQDVIHAITRLVEIVSKTAPLPSEANASVFFGEACVTWKSGAKEVSVLSRSGAENPKILRYTVGQDQQPEPQVNASPDDLRQAIRWLYQ